MNIEELKKLVKNSTAVLVLDNGEPSFVILKYDTYKDLVLQEPVKEVKISHAVNNYAINPANGLSADTMRPLLLPFSFLFGAGVSIPKMYMA